MEKQSQPAVSSTSSSTCSSSSTPNLNRSESFMKLNDLLLEFKNENHEHVKGCEAYRRDKTTIGGDQTSDALNILWWE